MSVNIRNAFIYLQTNILSPRRITTFLSFYFRNIYHTKQPRLLSFYWPEPNNQYIFSFLFFSFLFTFLFFYFRFSFLFSFFSFLFSFLFIYLLFKKKNSITRRNPGCFLFIGQNRTTNIFFLFFSFLFFLSTDTAQLRFNCSMLCLVASPNQVTVK